ncbi:MAG: transporter permease [Xanthobacteraceae bacterium]|jgi:branched-chain amino acid transport system substrate-binding protein|nr:transporter permease [Xanthobacteraceae bacterium]
MPIDKIARRTLAGLAALSACVAISAMPTAALADEQYFGIPSNRVGPYAAMGTGYYGGIIDYLNYVNLKGGVNGVKLTWTECETEYNAARTVECYQRLLHNGDKKLVVFDTLGTPGAYAVINRMAPDQVVLAQYGYGRTDAADGAVWPWVFNAAGQYWAQSTAHLNFIAQKEGGIEKMKGKTLVHLHIDTAYGREPIPAMREVAKQWGFKLVEIAVPPPGLEQQSQWLQIRREKADWVTFWGAGSGMNSTAITTAARIGFPRDKMLYVTFGGAEEDMIPAGDAAKGTFVAANAVPGKWPLIQDIEKVVYGGGNGNLQNPQRIGTAYYNRGVGAAVMWVEALKNAQKIHGKVGKEVHGAEFRDGYEALDITPEKLKELGIDGMLAPFKLSCAKHDGAEHWRMMQWNGSKFDIVSDWVGPNDPKFIRTMIEDSAAKYAAENKITPRTCP